MDLSTITGVVFGLALVVWAMSHGGGMANLVLFANGPAAAVVFGGSFAAILISFRMADMKQLIKVVLRAFMYPIPSPAEEIARILSFINLARKEGLLALESKLDGIGDRFFTKGIQLVIDGISADTVREILEVEAEIERQRHASGKKMLEMAGTFAPAFGMVETLVGLVLMLNNLSDPSQIGLGMAKALVATFYGALSANLIFLPLAGKLDLRAKQEFQLRQLMIEGIVAIQSGDKPQIVREKLNGFLAPTMRDTGK